jgi:hypothetical protein
MGLEPAMATPNGDNNNDERSKTWTIADWLMFSLGMGGAFYELFIDQTQNYFRYILILALLRLWQSAADLMRR